MLSCPLKLEFLYIILSIGRFSDYVFFIKNKKVQYKGNEVFINRFKMHIM